METKSKSNKNVYLLLIIFVILVLITGLLGFGAAAIFSLGVLFGAMWMSTWHVEHASAVTVEVQTPPIGADRDEISRRMSADTEREVAKIMSEIYGRGSNRRDQ